MREQENSSIDIMIDDVPVDIMMDNIRDQINIPQQQTDYLTPVMDMLQEMLEAADKKEDLDESNDIKDYIHQISVDIIELVCDKFDITIEYEEIDGDTVKELAMALYEFFILEFIDNVARFFYRYIKRNKATLSENLMDDNEKKDSTTIANKKKIKDKELLAINNNLPAVINSIIELDTDELEFIELAGESGSYSANLLMGLVGKGLMFGNFADAMLNRLDDTSLQLKDYIIIDLDSRLTKKINK